jgi:hypothetical protein
MGWHGMLRETEQVMIFHITFFISHLPLQSFEPASDSEHSNAEQAFHPVANEK